MMRTGGRGSLMPWRTSSIGSSARTVPAPTSTASASARNSCAWRRAASPVIQRLSPLARAIRPSSVLASFSVSQGRPRRIRDRKPAFSSAASRIISPSSMAMPARCRMARPPPETRGSGSSSAITTRATPASARETAQGGVLPVWAQGSSVT